MQQISCCLSSVSCQTRAKQFLISRRIISTKSSAFYGSVFDFFGFFFDLKRVEVFMVVLELLFYCHIANTSFCLNTDSNSYLGSESNSLQDLKGQLFGIPVTDTVLQSLKFCMVSLFFLDRKRID